MEERHYRRLTEIDYKIKLLKKWKEQIKKGGEHISAMGISAGFDVTIEVTAKHYIESIGYTERLKYAIAGNILLNLINNEISTLKEEKEKIQTISGKKWYEVWKF